MSGYVPDSDSGFDSFASTFVSALSATPANYALTAGQVAPLAGLKTTWDTAFADLTVKQAAAHAATAAKTSARAGLETVIRQLVQIVQNSDGVSDADKTAAGIPLLDTTKTPAAVPTTAPTGQIELTNRLEQTIHFVDSATPNSAAKPAGVRGCQIWIKIGATPPAGESELRYLATDTRTPYVSQFDAADAGKTAYYWLRWENTRGQTGPWSVTISATIPG